MNHSFPDDVQTTVKPRLLISLSRLAAGMALLAATVATGEEPPAVPVPPGDQTVASADNDHDELSTIPSIRLRGSVWRMKAGIVFLRIPVGMLTLSSKTCLRDVTGSHHVFFWVQGQNLAVEIRKKHDNTLVHRYLSGPLAFVSPEKKALVLWSPSGDKTISLGSHEHTVAARQELSPITVEIDEQGNLRGLHDLQFDLQIGNVPQDPGDTHVALKGAVAKLKSNFVFFRTPLGVMTVSSKTGIKNAKVGQDMTLWIHGNHAAIDLAQAGASTASSRFLTGPLTYASADRNSITLWTPQGEKAFPIARGKAALASIKEGTPITLELNHQGTVVDLRKSN